MPLDFNQLKAKSQPQFKDIPCPELGGDIRIRKLTGTRGLNVRQGFYSAEENPLTKEQKSIALVEIVAASVVNESGEAFLDSKEGRELIDAMDDEALNRIGYECLDFNNMVTAKKNSPTTSDSSSSSA